MHSPAQAILWQIYWRARWGFFAAAAFLCLAVLLARLLPTHWTIQMGEDAVPAVAWVLGVVCLFVDVILMAAFSMSGSDARNLTFANHMFVLPVRTTALVAWPMISGCLTVASAWIITACFVFRPGIAAPIWWPAAVMALVLAAFQALTWTPFAQRWLHGSLTVTILMTPFMVLLLAAFFDFRLSEPVAATLMLGLLPLAYVAAVSGLGRARRGQPYDWRAWNRLMDWLAQWRPAATHPFRSMSRAQLWYECRAHLIVLVFVACMIPCFLFVPALERHDVTLGWKLLGMLLAAPLLVAMLAGGALGNLIDASSKRDAASFVLVRPISSLSILKTKLVMAAIMTVALWGLFLAFISLLLLRPGFPESIGRVASGVPLWKAIGLPVLLLALLVTLTWKNMVESLWITLTGRKWVENAYSFGLTALLFAGIGIGLWLAFHPEQHALALAAVPWLVGLLLLLKCIAAALVVRGLIRARLTGLGGAAAMAAAWGAVVATLCGLALALLPAEAAMPAQLVPGIALLVPFARVAGAPLALEWNRHR